MPKPPSGVTSQSDSETCLSRDVLVAAIIESGRKKRRSYTYLRIALALKCIASGHERKR
jgi:hypothetical protein